MPEQHFERVDLASLSPEQAVDYGTRVTEVRLRDDAERIEQIKRQLVKAAGNERCGICCGLRSRSRS